MTAPDPAGHRIAIHYCRQCRWLLRAGWMAQELLQTFSDELAEVALRPGSGGIFQVFADETLVWDRKAEAGFPDIAELKRRVRDVIAPQRELGHTESKPSPSEP